MRAVREQQMFDRVLPVHHRDGKRSRWKLRTVEMIPIATLCIGVVEEHDKGQRSVGINIIKDERNRLMFRVASGTGKMPFVAKVFPLTCLRHRLKYRWMAHRSRRFALGEAVSLMAGASRGLAVPAVWGYGEIYGSWGLIEKSVLLLEYLDGHSPLAEVLAVNKDNQEKCLEALRRAIPLLVGLYRAGCNHISVNPGSIMLSADGLAQHDCMLDFEYARFLDAPSLELLVFEAATLVKYCRTFIAPSTIDRWVADLLDAMDVGDGYTRGSLRERFDYHFNTQLSRHDRIRIGNP